jgi:hypothetical protein
MRLCDRSEKAPCCVSQGARLAICDACGLCDPHCGRCALWRGGVKGRDIRRAADWKGKKAYEALHPETPFRLQNRIQLTNGHRSVFQWLECSWSEAKFAIQSFCAVRVNAVEITKHIITLCLLVQSSSSGGLVG